MSEELLFSFVVPTFNRPRQVAECLRAISEIAYPANRFEAVLTDDGGSQPLRDMIRQFDGKVQWQLIEQRNAGPAAARNAGVKKSRGKFIVFTDDDCRPAPDMLSELEKITGESPNAVIGGLTVNELNDNIYAAASQAMVDFLISYHHDNETRARFFTTTNLTMSRETFDSVGGFSDSFSLAAAEDRDFCERLVASGAPFIFAPQVAVNHAHHLTLATFCRQHYNYGRGRRQLDRARTRRGSPRDFERLGFYTGLLTDPVRRHRNLRGVVLSLLNVVSQAAYTTGYFSARLSRS